MVDGDGGGVLGAGVMLGEEGAEEREGEMGREPGGQTMRGGCA